MASFKNSRPSLAILGLCLFSLGLFLGTNWGKIRETKNLGDFENICDQYEPYVSNKIKESDYDRQNADFALHRRSKSSSLIDVFYSPKINTCVAYYSEELDKEWNEWGKPYKGEIYELEKTLFDIFANNEIVSLSMDSLTMSGVVKGDQEKLDAKLSELKSDNGGASFDEFKRKHGERQEILKKEEDTLAQKKDDVFRKNQECAKWLPTIEKREADHWQKNPKWEADVQEVFYSPKTNTCLYITHVKSGYLSSGAWQTLKTLMDVSHEIGGEPIESCNYISDDYSYDQYMEQVRKSGDAKWLENEERNKRNYEVACENFDWSIKTEYR